MGQITSMTEGATIGDFPSNLLAQRPTHGAMYCNSNLMRWLHKSSNAWSQGFLRIIAAGLEH